jgi:hypothetical protein
MVLMFGSGTTNVGGAAVIPRAKRDPPRQHGLLERRGRLFHERSEYFLMNRNSRGVPKCPCDVLRHLQGQKEASAVELQLDDVRILRNLIPNGPFARGDNLDEARFIYNHIISPF